MAGFAQGQPLGVQGLGGLLLLWQMVYVFIDGGKIGPVQVPQQAALAGAAHFRVISATEQAGRVKRTAFPSAWKPVMGAISTAFGRSKSL